MLDELVAHLRSYAQKEIAPRRREIDDLGEVPNDIWRGLGALGALGITAPSQYGGCELGYLAHARVMAEISSASPSVALAYGAHSNLCVNQIVLNGTAEQQAKYLPKLISGEHVGSLAMSEPNAGSDVTSMKLEAKEDTNGDFILNGSKAWITNATQSSVFVVYAKTSPGKKGISAFIITPRDGFSTGKKLDKLGMRGSATSELYFDNCKVQRDELLGGLNEGVYVLMKGLDYERVVLAAGPIGIMQKALKISVEYAQTREAFGQPIGHFQMIQDKLAMMYTRLHSCSAFLDKVAHDCDLGKADNKDAAAVILLCAEEATKSALDAIQIMGGNGYTEEYDAASLLRDAKLYEIGAGTTEIRKMIIAKKLLGIK